MRVALTPPTGGAPPTVTDASFGFGGMAAKTVCCPKAEAALIGQPWTRETLKVALAALSEDLPMAPGAPGGMVEFRRSLAASFLFKLFVDVSRRLESDAPGYASEVLPKEASAGTRFHRPMCKGAQYFQVQDGKEIGQPVMHQSAEVRAGSRS